MSPASAKAKAKGPERKRTRRQRRNVRNDVLFTVHPHSFTGAENTPCKETQLTMPVGKGIKREKPDFRTVLIQLSPFYWQGDASWGWNTKVPLWTGTFSLNVQFPAKFQLLFIFYFSRDIS